MINLSTSDILQTITGLFFIWVGIYNLSKNVHSKLAWLLLTLLFGYGITIFTNVITVNTRTLNEYILWQKITDWPLFICPIIFYHISLITTNKASKRNTHLLAFGYTLGAILFLVDLRGGIILKESILRTIDFRRIDGFAPGILLVPSIALVCCYILIATYYYYLKAKQGLHQYYPPALSGIFLLITGTMVALSYYTSINNPDLLFGIGISISMLLLAIPTMRNRLFSPSSETFDKVFGYKTITMTLLISFYLITFFLVSDEFSFSLFVFLILLVFLVIFTHSTYDWFSTFVNDLIFNPTSGLSLVNDKEVNQALKDYNRPMNLENSTLLRLNVINKKNKGESAAAVDTLRSVIKESIEYFKSEHNPHRRTKQNLKYYLLRMLTFDEAEEGQILWELGFEDYPVRIMTKESNKRPPMFRDFSPADYTATSRNAYLALKKEAIHDITWRISYLEKLSKKGLF